MHESIDPHDLLVSVEDRHDIWDAVGILSAARGVSLWIAHDHLSRSATALNVPRADVAAFVLWNGSLPV